MSPLILFYKCDLIRYGLLEGGRVTKLTLASVCSTFDPTVHCGMSLVCVATKHALVVKVRRN